MSAELINYAEEEKEVLIVAVMEYVPGRKEGWRDSVTEVLNVLQCQGNDLALYAPEGATAFSAGSGNMTVLMDGVILNRCESSVALFCSGVSGRRRRGRK